MLTLTEPIVDEILAVLRADLPGVIATRSPLFGDPAIALKDIAEFTHGVKRNHQMPAIEVFPTLTPIEHDGMSEMTFRHSIGIAILAVNASEELLTRTLERYAVCVFQALADRRAGADFTFALQFATEVPAQINWGFVTTAQGGFQNEVTFEVIATTSEQRA